jgi:hypothetical protein
MSRRLALVLLLTVFALTVSASVAYAAVVGPDGVIHGCYTTASDRNGNHALFLTENTCPPAPWP